MRTTSLVVLVLALLAVPAASRAQQLLANSEFHMDLVGWELPLPAQADWHADDADLSPSSGSVEMTNAASAASSDVVLLRQCVAAPAPGEYRLSASARLRPEYLATDGSVVIRLAIYPDSMDCSGGTVASGGQFVTQGLPPSWQIWEFAEVVFDIDANQLGANPHAGVEVAVRKSAAGGMLQAQADQVRLTFTESPTIFGDGFE